MFASEINDVHKSQMWLNTIQGTFFGFTRFKTPETQTFFNNKYA